jgi:hypothetical protein
MLIDENGNQVIKAMLEVTVDGTRQFVYLEAAQVAHILMAMRLMPYGDF